MRNLLTATQKEISKVYVREAEMHSHPRPRVKPVVNPDLRTRAMF